jgi:hypothetical protein
MKKYFFLPLLMLLVGAGIRAQSVSDEQAVKKSITNFFNGLSHLNQKEIRAEVTNDFVLLEDGEIWNVDSLIQAIEPLRKERFERINTLEFQTISFSENSSWVSYWNTADIIVNGIRKKVRWLESAVLIKVGKSWKISMLHSTRI